VIFTLASSGSSYGRCPSNTTNRGLGQLADDRVAWYENLVAQPEVHIQVMADRFKARARTATAAEKPALWKTMTAIWPAYDEYQGRTSREIPVVVIERTA
jgi:deazaflavin-dependent oxidoreductase (nitroreductase family)